MSSNVRAGRHGRVQSIDLSADRAPSAPTVWQRLLAKLAAIAHTFASHDARREAYLAASVDLKDYECRLRSLDDDERSRARYLGETLWL
jgi:hypothetical protein